LMHSELGEGFVPAAAEVDLDAAGDAFERAATLAEELGDSAALAAATRELGCIDVGRVRAWFIDRMTTGEHIPLMARVSMGESIDQVIESLPIAPMVHAAGEHLHRALELFERLGDRRGVMSSIIAMAYLDFGPDVHMGPNAAQRIEEIRRLSTRLRALAKESERAAADAQMAYGVHVFARAKVTPDLAVSRGEEAYHAAKILADRSLEFLAAGGTAMAVLDLGDVGAADRWLDLAAEAASAEPTPLRARRLELWRALARGRAGDAQAMRAHFDRALRLATDQGRPAGRCEVLARLALEAARLGAERGDEELLDLAERSATEAKELAALFVTHHPWGAQGDAALAEVALARGDLAGAARSGMAVVAEFMESKHEDLYPEMLLPAGRAVLAGGEDADKQLVGSFLQMLLAMTAQRTVDEEIRVRWFKGPVGSEWARLAGPLSDERFVAGRGEGALTRLDDDELVMLGMLTEGMTTGEIAERLGSAEPDVRLRLQEMFAKIGASSRVEATALALREGVL